ncbi:hypothetical protein NM688_g1612 [Phlebia brevispora]|uniref:Uncharacterized protein n=1 Tax=Phlebia brevispora TaxID=194682 RepID=A0ACC1TAY1_9APHY|nr:hypothetical protein NM688_g1612 [Phlebia brevispora]
MLSEKAKGKQRAFGPIEEAPAPEELKKLVIRFTEGVPDLTLYASDTDTVRDIKRNIRNARSQLKDRRLRLIHSGRLLADDTVFCSWLASLEDKQHHNETSESFEASQPPSTIWLHCSVGPQLQPGEADETKVQQAQLKPLRGFDRLAAAGFSEQDIANIRSQFHAHSSGDYLDQEFATDEDFDEHARVLEEQWIDSLDNAGTASLSNSSAQSSRTFVSGVLLGFFFPLIPVFFFFDSRPAVFWDDGTEHDIINTSPFPKTVQLGVAVGMLMNFFFGWWTWFLAAP